MKSTQVSSWLLVFILWVCSYQQIWTGMVPKGSKAKSNNTITNKQTNQTTKQPKVMLKIKTSSTTVKPEIKNTTDFDLDGRSAFINNHFVPEAEESISYTPSPLHDILQQQMQTVLTNTDTSFQSYKNNTSQVKEYLHDDNVRTQKLPKNPLQSYEMSKIYDYDDEEIHEYGPENDCTDCEDIQESLLLNSATLANHEHENLQNPHSNVFEESFHSKPFDSSNYGLQTIAEQSVSNENKTQNDNIETNNYLQQTKTNQGILYDSPLYDDLITKPTQQMRHNNNAEAKPISKPKTTNNAQRYYGQSNIMEQYLQTQNIPHNQYVQSKPLEHYGSTNKNPITNQNYADKSKSQQNQKPYYDLEKTSQLWLNYQKPTQNSKTHSKQQTKQTYNNPESIFNNKPFYKNNYTSASSISLLSNYANDYTEPLNSPGIFNSPNLSSTPIFAYDNMNTETASSISTTSMHNKKFKTVSSSIQYVSTPFADLVFKYSIGMAKHSRAANNTSDNKTKPHL